MAGEPERGQQTPSENTIFNKTFYRFVFNFVGVVAGVLALILVVGHLAGLTA